MKDVKVTVIVLTYNADWKKLKGTILSIWLQKYTDYEIIFADDGSKVKWNEQIVKLMENLGNCNFRFVDSKVNVGTVKNICNAIKEANGKYIKLISPGDMLLNGDVLEKWVDFIEKNYADVTFGDAVYYKSVEGKITKIQCINSPANLEVYIEPQKYNSLFVDYILGNDSVLGASMLMKRDVMMVYLEEIKDKVKYAEDYMVRMMIFDQRRILHFPEAVIWYEYGDGISTAKENKWAQLLHKDFEMTNELIKERSDVVSVIAKRYIKYLSCNIEKAVFRKISKCFMFPTVIFWRYKAIHSNNLTVIDGDVNYAQKLLDYKE